MRIGGFEKFSLIDYPGKVCAIIFTQGCNFRCPFCHNPELVLPELFASPISFKEILGFLMERRGLIDAVEFTGGEPLLQNDIEERIQEVKNFGFLVKLDTNGSFPEKLERLIKLGLINYLAMDVKAPLEDYFKVTQAEVDLENVRRSIDIIKSFEGEYEFRTTVIRGFHERDSIMRIASLIKGAELYFIQKPHFEKIVDGSFILKESFSEEELNDFVQIASRFVKRVGIR